VRLWKAHALFDGDVRRFGRSCSSGRRDARRALTAACSAGRAISTVQPSGVANVLSGGGTLLPDVAYMTTKWRPISPFPGQNI